MALPIVHHPDYDAASVGSDHRFPMRKFSQVAKRLLEDGLVAPGGFYEPVHALESWLTLAHTPRYVDGVLNGTLTRIEQRQIGFEMTGAVARRSRAAVAGTLLAGRLALEQGVACNTAGGSHHAHADYGAGFCVFNDVAVAIEVLLAEGAISSALVLDCDVHQGDGTARMFDGRNEVTTVSVHCETNWPTRRARSDHDVDVPEGTGDMAYLALLRELLEALLKRNRPDIVFYNAGVDPHQDDRLGKLSLTDQGIADREHLVLSALIAKGIPVVGVLGGGYARDVDHLAFLHTRLHGSAASILSQNV